MDTPELVGAAEGPQEVQQLQRSILAVEGRRLFLCGGFPFLLCERMFFSVFFEVSLCFCGGRDGGGM